jgi:type IV pilus assembly protein PilB
MAGRLKLGQILVTKGLIAPEQLASALGEQERWGSRLGMTLVRLGFLEEETLVHVLASQLRLPVARIRGKTVNPEVLERVPMETAEKYRCLPLFLRDEGGVQHLVLAMEDPSDLEALDELAFQIGEKLRPVLVAPTELEEAMHRHYHGVSAGANADPLPSHRETAAEEVDTAPELPPLDLTVDSDLEAAAEELEAAARALDPAARAGPLEAEDDLGSPDPAELSDELGGLSQGFEADAMEAGPTDDDVGSEESATRASSEIDGLSLEAPPTADAEAAPEPAQPQEAAAGAAPAAAAMEPRVILRALSQLLVEKGVISREEFVQRLREIAEEEEEAGAAGPGRAA